MTPHVLHPKAQDELDDLVEHFLRIDPKVGIAFQARYQMHLSRIKAAPELHRARKHGIRRVNLAPRYHEYFIAYIIADDRVVIVAVGKGKRREYYFKDRLEEAKNL